MSLENLILILKVIILLIGNLKVYTKIFMYL